MNKPYLHIAAGLLVLTWHLLATAASGESPRSERGSRGAGGPPPTLEEAVQSAYTRHPQQQALAAQGQEVDALSVRAGSFIADNPALGATYKTDQVGSDEGFREWEAGVALPLWRFGQRTAQGAVARSAANALDQARRGLLLAVAGEVRERMWGAALMQNNLELARKEWDTAVTLERNVQRRVELGELAKTDLLLARDATLTKRAAYLRAETEFYKARERYESYTGLDRLPRRRGETRTELSAIPDDHAQLAEVTARVARAVAQIAAVRREGAGAPEVFVGGSGERDDSAGDFDNRLGVTINLPIGTKAHTGPAVAAAERARAEAQSEHDTLYRQLTLALAEAAQEAESAQAELELAQGQNRLAQENLRLAQVAFDAGETDLVGVLRVQALAFAAERRERELRITRQRAIARYNQAAGVLP